MRSLCSSHVASVLSISLALMLLLSSPALAWAAPLEPFSFENVDIPTVVKHVARITGIAFIFDPEQVKGKITVLSPKDVSPVEALKLLESALALHGYTVLSGAEGILIVPAEQVAPEAMTVEVVRLKYAWAGELAHTLSWVAPPWVRIVPHLPTNSLILSGPSTAVAEMIDIVK